MNLRILEQCIVLIILFGVHPGNRREYYHCSILLFHILDSNALYLSESSVEYVNRVNWYIQITPNVQPALGYLALALMVIPF